MSGKAGWLLAGAILVAMGSQAHAQVGITIGNPYGGGVVIGTPGYGNGYGGYNPVYAPRYYSSGYAGYAPAYNSGYAGYAPAYNSGYATYAPPVVYARPYVVPNYGYGYRPYGGGYGYRPYGRGYGRRW